MKQILASRYLLRIDSGFDENKILHFGEIEKDNFFL
jgi:hypothetical protein